MESRTDAGYEIRCNTCGATVASTAEACPGCGTVLLGEGVPPSPAPALLTSATTVAPVGAASIAPVPHSALRAYAVGRSDWEYAGFWLRASAHLFDTMICTALIIASLFVPYLWFTAVPFVLFYEPVMVASRWQATIGKRLLGLTVVTMGGGRVGFARSLVRHFAKFISGAILGIGFLLIAFTDRKRGLHDMIARTGVVWG